MKKEREIRVFHVRSFKAVRSDDGKTTKIVGHAAVFNQPTEIGFFTEEVAPGFFSSALKTSDVRALFNHDPNFVLGRNKSGTLRMAEDDIGLRVEIDASDSQLVRDLVITPLERGDIDGMSFAWSTKTDQWTKDDDGNMKRRLIEADELYDVSVVTYPAYPQTDVAVASRSFDAWKEKELRGVVPFSSHGDLPKIDEDASWDAAAAKKRIAKWASSDGSGDKDKIDFSKYKEGAAWFDSANPKDVGSYKLFHHDIKDGQLAHHWHGTAAAMGALLGARGGVKIPDGDREGVYNHLVKEYKRFGKTAPDFRSLMAMPLEERFRALGIRAKKDDKDGPIDYSIHGDMPKLPENEKWDPEAAKQRCMRWASSDGSGSPDMVDWEKYSMACAHRSLGDNGDGIDDGDMSNGDDEDIHSTNEFRFMHHDVADGQLHHHFRGAVASMHDLLNGDAGQISDEDREACYNHLAQEYKRFGMTPPDYRSARAKEPKDLNAAKAAADRRRRDLKLKQLQNA